jgi:signal transduction histidine kinase
MARPRNSRNALAWQAAVILLPVIALAALGAFYLRQDRLLVRHEAEERARMLAQEIAQKLWRGLTNSAGLGEEYAFRIDDDGALLSPLSYQRAPEPRPLDLAKLTAEQTGLWQQSDAAALGRLLEADVPVDFQAVANYRYAATLAAERRLGEAYEVFRGVYQRFPRAVSEAGLPVALMAGLRALELPSESSSTKWARPLSWDILCRLGIAEPSALTPMIFERAARSGALPDSRLREHREQWETHEALRELYRASRDQLSSPEEAPIFWIRSGAERWLASRVDEQTTNHWIVCRQIDGAAKAPMLRTTNSSLDGLRAMRVTVGSEAQITPASLAGVLPPDVIPNYLSLGLVAASEPVILTPTAPVLAAAAHAEKGRDLLKVSLHLARPELLYARQRQRVVWFGLLIAVSIVAALVGLGSAWRNFQKQERLAELKDNFVSSVSHELRAPIASVRLMAEGLERGRVPDPEKQREYHHFIVQECQRLSALIQNVLDFSRIDQGRKQYEFESADVLRLVRETVKAMEPTAAERQIVLGLPPAAESSLNAVVDARAIQQALINLIDNAVKHSSPGSEVTVNVCAQKAAAQPMLEISVEDHGEGIPKAEQERIFERFYRVGSELRRQTPGAGIGLSIVKHIVDAHGGRVRVESEPGKGSRFTIEIPLKG